MTGPEHY
jgi:hypothetical protein